MLFKDRIISYLQYMGYREITPFFGGKMQVFEISPNEHKIFVAKIGRITSVRKGPDLRNSYLITKNIKKEAKEWSKNGTSKRIS